MTKDPGMDAITGTTVEMERIRGRRFVIPGYGRYVGCTDPFYFLKLFVTSRPGDCAACLLPGHPVQSPAPRVKAVDNKHVCKGEGPVSLHLYIVFIVRDDVVG